MAIFQNMFIWPIGNEAESDEMPESTDENWFGEVWFDQEENIEGRMETDVDENQNEANKTNIENAKAVTSLQKNLNSNKLMDLNFTAFKLKFNPRHRYNNFEFILILKSTNKWACF